MQEMFLLFTFYPIGVYSNKKHEIMNTQKPFL